MRCSWIFDDEMTSKAVRAAMDYEREQALTVITAAAKN